MMFQPPHFYPGWKGVNYTRHFEQHFGRALTTDELVVIESLERQRLKGKGIRAVIYDPSGLISPTVETYFKWIVNFICAIGDRYSVNRLQAVFAASATRSKSCARAFPRARTRAWTWRSHNNARGFWFDHILVLDWQTRYKSLPRIQEAWEQVNRALLPCLPDGAKYSSFIVHTRCPLPFYKTVPTFVYVETPSAIAYEAEKRELQHAYRSRRGRLAYERRYERAQKKWADDVDLYRYFHRYARYSANPSPPPVRPAILRRPLAPPRSPRKPKPSEAPSFNLPVHFSGFYPFNLEVTTTPNPTGNCKLPVALTTDSPNSDAFVG